MTVSKDLTEQMSGEYLQIIAEHWPAPTATGLSK